MLRKKISNETRENIFQAYGTLKSKTKVAKQFNLNLRTLNKVLQNQNAECLLEPIKKSYQDQKYEQLNSKVLVYYNQLKQLNVPVTKKLLKSYAQSILDIDCIPTGSWLKWFIQNYKIDLIYKKTHVKKNKEHTSIKNTSIQKPQEQNNDEILLLKNIKKIHPQTELILEQHRERLLLQKQFE